MRSGAALRGLLPDWRFIVQEVAERILYGFLLCPPRVFAELPDAPMLGARDFDGM
jgi:hypothetical protein